MIHLLIDNEGRRKEYSEDDARWLSARCTIMACGVPHFKESGKHEFYDLTEYVIYHPGTRNSRMISIGDIDARLATREPIISCGRCKLPLSECKCEPR